MNNYSYSVAIMTFNGAGRVGHLLDTIADLPSMNKMDDLVVVNDYMPDMIGGPAPTNRLNLTEVMKDFPEWYVAQAKAWGNAQGTAKLAMDTCVTDFVFLLEDDQIATGDPFKDVIDFLETCPKDLADKTGAIYLSHIQANQLKKMDWKDMPNYFYSHIDEFKCPDVRGDNTNVSLGMVAHGQGSLINRRVYKECGGYDLDWHAFDQSLSYRIWLNTDYIIYTFPSDPFVHCGACAQCGDIYSHQEAGRQGSGDRCRETFGGTPEQVEASLGKRIDEKVVPVWQPILTEAYNKWQNQVLV